MDKIEAILEKVFDSTKDVAFFPMLPQLDYLFTLKAIAMYKPDCILIEGIIRYDVLIPCLADEVTHSRFFYRLFLS